MEIQTGGSLIVGVKSVEDVVPLIWCTIVLMQLMIGLVQSLCDVGVILG